MMQNWTWKITTKNENDKKFKIHKKDTINGYVYVENYKKSIAYNIG